MKKIIFRGLRKLGILKNISLYPRVKVGNRTLRTPIINGVGINNFLYLSEPWMQSILDKLIKNNTCFLDVGVNIGQTLLKVKSVNPDIKYIGFEPNPSCVHYCKSLIKVNNFRNVDIYPVGISNETNIVKLNMFHDDDTDSSASMVKNFRDAGNIKKSIFVPIYNFSEISELKEQKINVVKIDVEGAELEVLIGLNSLIQQFAPFILIEILPCYTEENKERLTRQKSIEDLLTKEDYKIFRIIKINNEFERIEEISSIGIHSDLNSCDYIFCPKSKSKELFELFN